MQASEPPAGSKRSETDPERNDPVSPYPANISGPSVIPSLQDFLRKSNRLFGIRSGESTGTQNGTTPIEDFRDDSWFKYIHENGRKEMENKLTQALTEFLEKAAWKRFRAGTHSNGNSSSSSAESMKELPVSMQESLEDQLSKVEKAVERFFKFCFFRPFVGEGENSGDKLPGWILAFALYELFVTSSHAATVARALLETTGVENTSTTNQKHVERSIFNRISRWMSRERMKQRDPEKGPDMDPDNGETGNVQESSALSGGASTSITTSHDADSSDRISSEDTGELEKAMSRRYLKYTDKTLENSEILSGVASLLTALKLTSRNPNTKQNVESKMSTWQTLSPFKNDPNDDHARSSLGSLENPLDYLESDEKIDPKAKDMFQTLAEMWKASKSQWRRNKLSAGLWLLKYEGNMEGPGNHSCPSHSMAIVDHVELSVFLCEGIFETLVDLPAVDEISMEDQHMENEPLNDPVIFPSKVFQGTKSFWRYWMEYKEEFQGRRKSEISTFALGYGERGLDTDLWGGDGFDARSSNL